jgi:hypothetical protein
MFSMSSLMRFGLSGLPSPEGPAFIFEVDIARVLLAAIPMDGANALLRLARLSTEAVIIVAGSFIALITTGAVCGVNPTKKHIRNAPIIGNGFSQKLSSDSTTAECLGLPELSKGC